MDLHWFMVMLLMTMILEMCTSEQCPSDKTTSVKLSVSGHQNRTGHWIIKVDAARDDPKREGKHWVPKSFAIDVEQKSLSCESREYILLTATTVASPSVGICPAVSSDVIADVGYIPLDSCPPEGYEFIKGQSYYKLYTTGLLWKDARDKCAHEGAHLMVINSEAEAEVYKTFFSRAQNSPIKNVTNRNYAFMGFHDLITEGVYQTVQGTPLSETGYTTWGPGEPAAGRNENCGCADSLARLYDVDCDWRCFFICEFDV